MSRKDSVGIAMDYGMDGRGSIPCRDKRFVSSLTAFRPAPRPTQYPIHWEPGALSSDMGVKATTHLHKNGGARPPLPHMSCWCCGYLFKYRDNFTFTYSHVTGAVSDCVFSH
jgi:hypothetical protein